MTTDTRSVAEEIWNSRHPDGWQADHLTTGEWNAYVAPIAITLDELVSLGYVISRADEAATNADVGPDGH